MKTNMTTEQVLFTGMLMASTEGMAHFVKIAKVTLRSDGSVYRPEFEIHLASGVKLLVKVEVLEDKP